MPDESEHYRALISIALDEVCKLEGRLFLLGKAKCLEDGTRAHDVFCRRFRLLLVSCLLLAGDALSTIQHTHLWDFSDRKTSYYRLY